MTDWGALYHDHVEALAGLAASLDDDRIASTVPGTPAWTVHDVYAHLAGGPADQVAGRTEGAPGPQWTARHVAERQGVALGDLVAELRSNADAAAASTVDNPSPGVVWDIAVHHADLHEALGLGMPAEHFWAPVLAMLGPRVLDALPVTLTCDTSDGTASYGGGGPATDVAAYELFRALFSRRSRAQTRAWGTGLSDEQLDTIGVFGPREDDQPLPS